MLPCLCSVPRSQHGRQLLTLPPAPAFRARTCTRRRPTLSFPRPDGVDPPATAEVVCCEDPQHTYTHTLSLASSSAIDGVLLHRIPRHLGHPLPCALIAASSLLPPSHTRACPPPAPPSHVQIVTKAVAMRRDVVRDSDTACGRATTRFRRAGEPT